MKQGNVVLVALYDLDSFPVRTLHAILKEAGFNVHTIFFKHLNPNNTMDFAKDEEIGCLVDMIKGLNPILVGISLRSTHFKLACKMTKEIKTNVSAPVIWGGVHPTIRPGQCIKFADIVCVGEGEGPIVDLATKLSKGEEIDRIQNLWIRRGDRIIKNDLRPLIQNLDSLPFPDFSNENKYLVEHGKILPLPGQDERGSYYVMTSRGCPFSCTYCCNNALRRIYKDKGSYVRRRSVDSVIAELIVAKRIFKNLKFIAFEDDVFTFDIDWIRDFCTKYKRGVALPFFCYCHPKATNEEIIRLIKDAGVKCMTMGVQTGSEEIRHKYFNRHDTNEEIINASRILHKYKIDCAYDVILDNPFETDENKKETFDLFMRLPRPFVLHMHTLTHFPETELTRVLLEKGLISEGDVEDQKEESYTRWTPVLDTRRSKENLYWDNLYYLTQKKYVPKRVLLWLSRIKYFKRNPGLLTSLLRLTTANIYAIKPGSIRWYLWTKVIRGSRLVD